MGRVFRLRASCASADEPDPPGCDVLVRANAAVAPCRHGSAAPRPAIASTLSQSQRNMLARVLKIARSNRFRERAAIAGVTDEAILRALPRRILRYGRIKATWLTSTASADEFSIARFGSEKHIFHELGHVLDDLIHPGLFAGEANLSMAGIYRAEVFASILQHGKVTAAGQAHAAIAALHAKTRLLIWPGVLSLSSAMNTSWIYYCDNFINEE